MHDLLALLGPTRTASVAALTTGAGARSIGRWIASGRLVRLHPGWVTVPELAQSWTVRAHAATGYANAPLSHISALVVHGAVDDEVTRLHVTVSGRRRVRSSRWLVVHRSGNPVDVRLVRGLPTTSLARSLVDTWGTAHRARSMRGFDGVARGAVLRSTRGRQLTVGALSAELSLRPELPGRAELAKLLRLIAGGCQSELEIFGVEHVLAIPGLPPCRQQYRVHLGGGHVDIDAAWPEAKLAVELDGAAFHGSQEARERPPPRCGARGGRLARVALQLPPADSRTRRLPGRDPRRLPTSAGRCPVTGQFRARNGRPRDNAQPEALRRGGRPRRRRPDRTRSRRPR